MATSLEQYVNMVQTMSTSGKIHISQGIKHLYFNTNIQISNSIYMLVTPAPLSPHLDLDSTYR